MSNVQDGLYTVVCGYEMDPCDLLTNSHEQIVAASIPFVQAAHITRTLNEHGEGDMQYWMIPASLHDHLQADAPHSCGHSGTMVWIDTRDAGIEVGHVREG